MLFVIGVVMPVIGLRYSRAMNAHSDGPQQDAPRMLR